jgi:hypothetical protein
VERISELETTLAVTSNYSSLLCSVLQLLVAANIVPSLLSHATLMTEEMHSSETQVLTRATQCEIPEDSILHSHCHKNLTSYIFIFCFGYTTKMKNMN